MCHTVLLVTRKKKKGGTINQIEGTQERESGEGGNIKKRWNVRCREHTSFFFCIFFFSFLKNCWNSVVATSASSTVPF